MSLRTPAVGTPKTGDRNTDLLLQAMRERIEALASHAEAMEIRLVKAEAGAAEETQATAVQEAEAGAAGADGLFTEEYESAELTITAGTTQALTHQLGGKPKLVDIVLRCKTAEYGYAVGDEVAPAISDVDDTNSATVLKRGVVVTRTATQLFVTYGQNAFYGYNRTAGSVGEWVGFTAANWRALVRAYR